MTSKAIKIIGVKDLEQLNECIRLQIIMDRSIAISQKNTTEYYDLLNKENRILNQCIEKEIDINNHEKYSKLVVDIFNKKIKSSIEFNKLQEDYDKANEEIERYTQLISPKSITKIESTILINSDTKEQINGTIIWMGKEKYLFSPYTISQVQDILRYGDGYRSRPFDPITRRNYRQYRR